MSTFYATLPFKLTGHVVYLVENIQSFIFE